MSITDALDHALDAHGQDPDLPMIFAGLWDRDGTRYLGARGTLDRSSGEAATPAARFALASMTKPWPRWPCFSRWKLARSSWTPP